MDLLNQLREQRAARYAELEALGADTENRAIDLSAVETISADIETLDARIAGLETITARSAAAATAATGLGLVVTEGDENRTYRKGGDHSFFSDLVNRGTDMEAAGRIQRHLVESRAGLDGTAGHGAELMVPSFITDAIIEPQFAGVFLNLLTQDDLPEGVSSVLETKLGFGENADDEGKVKAAGTPTEMDVNTDVVEAKVYDKSVQATLPFFLLQRSAIKFDEAVATEIDRQLAVKHNRKAIAETLAAGYEKVTVAASENGMTFAQFSTLLNQAEKKVLKGRKDRTEAIVMTADLWAWALDQNDATGRPLVHASAAPAVAAAVGTGLGVGLVGTTRTGTPIFVEPYLDSDAKQRIVVGRFSDIIARRSATYSRVVEGVSLAKVVQGYDYGSVATKRHTGSLVVIEGAGLNALAV